MSIEETVSALMQEGKGILLAGESNDIENQRLAAFGANAEDARTAYREILFTTPGIEEHLSGIVLTPEAVMESSGGASFPELIIAKNISTGVLIDPDTVSDGKLSSVLTDGVSHGISFAVFVTNISVSGDAVSDELQKNISALVARAKISLSVGVIPIVALDVSMYGAHTAAQAEDCLLETVSLLSDSLKSETLDVKSIIVAISMAVSGSDNPVRADSADVAERTVRAATTAIPQDIGGVVFLSDAQSPEEATANLNSIARLEPLPWPVAFCFSRALQDPVLAAWKGNEENISDAQAIFEERLSLLSRADAAGYSKTLEEH